MEEKNLESQLKELVGERVTTSHFERWFYTSDLVNVPAWVKRRFQTMPVAVVKPGTTQEVSSILSYCSSHKIPVVARGGGSSGVFSAVPKKGGIVLDLRDLTQVLKVDKEKLSVTVEAGITWWELDKKLKSHGLAVKSYPSSARSATVGGWIMGSGLGIGSLKYGTVSEQLLSAEVVLADGTVKEFERWQGLEWFFETEGMLGILTKVSLEVRPLPESTSSHLIYFAEIKHLFDFLDPLVNTTPSPYAVEILDASYLSLLKAAGGEVTDFSPGSGTLLVTYQGEKGEVEACKKVVKELAASYHGEEREGADREWRQRFNMLRVRRAVPAIIPASVRVPIAKLNRFYARLGKLKKRPIALLGHVVSRNECMLMPMVATDERKPREYTLALHMPRELANLALSVGGKPSGGVGVWNAPYSRQVLSRQKEAEVVNKKRELDPLGILNPGMWLDPPTLFKPGFYQLAMTAASLLDSVTPAGKPETMVPDRQGEMANCVRCGYCMSYCPTRGKWLSSTPRGRILMTRNLLSPGAEKAGEITPDYVKSVFECTLCGRCKVDCSVDIQSPRMWMDLREELVAKGFTPDSLKTVIANAEQAHNVLAKPNEQRANWSKQLKLPYQLETKKQARVVYFVGCVTSLYPSVQGIARSFSRILDAAGTDFTILGGEEWCCGYPLLSAGHKEAAAKTMEHNIDKIQGMAAESVVMTCPGCYRVWREEYTAITGKSIPFGVFHSTEFIAKLLSQGKLKLGELKESVTYHDPCDIGRNSGLFDEPRDILNQIPALELVEMENNREYTNCCGAGGELLVSNPGLSLEIARRKVGEVLATKTRTLVTACPTCIMALSAAKAAEKAPFDILDITQLVEKSMLVPQKEETKKPVVVKEKVALGKATHVYRLGAIEYSKAFQLQKELNRRRAESEIVDTLLLLQHPPTITIGKAGKLENVLVSKAELASQGVSLFFVDRGGDVTYHGPGQLVGYPIIHLGERGNDLHKYVHDLEEVLIRVLDDFGIKGSTDASHAGIWVNNQEIAAIGISVKKWVTMHGFALNVNPEMRLFSLINPCGFQDRKAVSMASLLSRQIPMEAVTEKVLAHFAEVFETHLELKPEKELGS